MKKLLLTGFEPFLQFPINPTEKVVKSLNGRTIGNYEIVGELLPVDFTESPKRALEALEKHNPDAVISLGLSGGRSCITPERIAINCRDGAADNKGVALQDQPIYEEGADGYFSTLPIRQFVNVLKENGIPADISNTAGAYLCNNVMYVVQHELRTQGKDIPAGFVHVPASHELVIHGGKPMPSISDADLLKAVQLMIEVLG